MKIDLDFLRVKKDLLVREAERLLSIQENVGGNDHSYLVKSIVNEPDFIQGNLSFCFVQHCIRSTDDIYDILMSDKEHHKRCDINFNPDVINMWRTIDRKYKKFRPEPGDIVLGHHSKKDVFQTNGFLGIVKSVDASLNMEIIEASVINNYDDEPRHQQFDGIKVRTRSLVGKGRSKILGVFTPWFF